MRKFECHITIYKPQSTQLAREVFSISEKHKMKTSWITGEPVLGVGKWFYISGYSEEFDDLLNRMKNAAEELRNRQVEVVREKIEEILYDTKTNHFTCGVDCMACLSE